MKFVIAAALSFVLVTAAAAQDVPEASKMDLWCGIAFGLVIADAPADVTPDLKAIYQKGSEDLVDRATEVHLGAGYTTETFDTYKQQLTDEINAEISTVDGKPDYAFEDCSALIGL